MRFSGRSDLVSRLAAAAAVAGLFAVAVTMEKESKSASRKPGEPDSSTEPLGLQVKRAAEHGRGRTAGNPAEIPWPGWKDVLWRVYDGVQRHRVLSVAGSVVFYSLLAIVPAITAFVSFYGLFFNPGTISDHLSFLAGVMPSSGYDIVQDQITRIVSKSDGKLTFGFIVGFAIAIWSANAGIKGLFDGLNVVYEEDEKRSFVRLNLVSLAFTAAALVMAAIAIAAIVVFPLVLAFVGVGVSAPGLALLRWPALLVVMMTGLALVYRFGPSRREAKWRWLSVGSAFASLAWLAGSLAFSWYLSNFANYNATYGSLGAVIGLMMWMWLSAIVVLLGAELNAEIEHQTARDSTVGAEKPLGARGAVMADTVGAAAE
jgi:membrane protein